MKKYVIREIHESYHVITVDDEIDIDELINYCNSHEKQFEDGVNAMECFLNENKIRYGFDYNIGKNEGGDIWDGLDLYDEIEMEI